MAKPGQFSFRRILLSRILLLSVPVLLIGEFVAFRKARSSLLETARWNLTASAIRKGESIIDAIAALKTNMLLASQTTVLQSGTAKEAQQFLNQLAPKLPTQIQCIQLTQIQTSSIVASTCGNGAISFPADGLWSQQQQRMPTLNPVKIKTLLPKDLPKTQRVMQFHQSQRQSQLQLLLSAPVYDRFGHLSYALTVQSALHQKERDQAWSLAGSTVVIAQNGTILAHPIFSHVGLNIQQQTDAERLQSIVRNAVAGREDSLHLSFQNDGVRLLAGYTAIPSPITDEPNQHWIILAVTRLDTALFDLQDIKLILLVLTFGLLGASLLATLYLSRDLARPLEKLRDYALKLQNHHISERVPHDFKIREFNQLAEALDQMVKRLRASAEEIETAWEEAQAANRLKSEFLATTSHELRTPLNAIIGCVRLIRDGCCDDREEEIEFLERADEAAIHLLGIINDLLDIARIEAGKLTVVMEAIDLRQVLKEVVNLQVHHIHQEGLQIVAPEYPDSVLVQADPAKLKQVLINVIGNAVKFTQQGSITINIEMEPVGNCVDDVSTSQVVITVEDTGVGIDPTEQHKLFHPFVTVDGTTTRKFGGTGLGLAISRKLIELMGGSIMLFSAGIGQGTTVAITMPMISISSLRPHSHVDLGMSSRR